MDFEASMDSAGQLFHARQLPPQLGAPRRGQTIGLLVAGRVVLLKTLDPAVFEKPAESAIERAGTQADAAAAEGFDILHQSVAMARLVREADEDQGDGFGKRFGTVRLFRDMSHNDILRGTGNPVKRRFSVRSNKTGCASGEPVR